MGIGLRKRKEDDKEENGRRGEDEGNKKRKREGDENQAGEEGNEKGERKK